MNFDRAKVPGRDSCAAASVIVVTAHASKTVALRATCKFFRLQQR
jgi:hypothetical protein